jgi:hypothetical protein
VDVWALVLEIVEEGKLRLVTVAVGIKLVVYGFVGLLEIRYDPVPATLTMIRIRALRSFQR